MTRCLKAEHVVGKERNSQRSLEPGYRRLGLTFPKITTHSIKHFNTEVKHPASRFHVSCARHRDFRLKLKLSSRRWSKVHSWSPIINLNLALSGGSVVTGLHHWILLSWTLGLLRKELAGLRPLAPSPQQAAYLQQNTRNPRQRPFRDWR